MPRLSLSLFGGVEFASDGVPLTGFDSDKSRALLAYLAVESARPHRRAALVGLLWPESDEAAARRSLSQALLVVRQATGDYTARPPFLRIARDAIQFDAASDHALDVAAFEERLAAVEAHRHQAGAVCAECLARLREAAELYRGPFLHGFFPRAGEEFETWAGLRREAHHQQALRALSLLAARSGQLGDHAAGLRWARRALSLDAAHEESHRQVMLLLAQAGERSAALAQYESCARALGEMLGVEPDEETRALYERIRGAGLGRSPGVAPAPLRSARPERLPAPLTSFIGRERELAELDRLLADPGCRLVTVAGPGGVGKTHLAIKVAQAAAGRFAQGAAFVALAPVGEPALIVPAIAAALGFVFSGRADAKTELVEHLRPQQLLLVLDNCEQLRAGAGLFAEILQAAPLVKLLITSRELLGITGEWAVDLQGLPLAQTSAQGAGAVALFLERARQARSGFVAGGSELEAASEICRLVDGVPLGIELAAAWLRVLSCAEIAAEIARSIAFLSSPADAGPERHRSMQAVFDHSWRLLGDDERRALRRLSVFRGGIGREAAAEVAGATLLDLSRLGAKSLVRRAPGGGYDMHELVRQFAYEQLLGTGEATQIHQRHLRYLLRAVEAAEPQLTGGDQLGALQSLERLLPDVRAALAWALGSGDEEAEELALRLADSLGTFWGVRGHFAEGKQWLEEALARYQAHVTLAELMLDSPEAARTRARLGLRASALRSLGQLAQYLNPLEARRLLEEALALQQALGDQRGIIKALQSLGTVVLGQGDHTLARSLLNESLELARSLGDAGAVATTLLALAYIAHHMHDRAAAERYSAQSLEIRRAIGDRVGAARALNNLGELARGGGDDERALALYSECLATLRELGFAVGVASVTHNIGQMALRRGDPAGARASFAESLALYQALGSRIGMAECLAGFGAVAAAAGDPLKAAHIFGAVERLRATTNMMFAPADQESLGRHLAAARDAAGSQEDFDTAWAAGQLIPPEALIAEILGRAI